MSRSSAAKRDWPGRVVVAVIGMAMPVAYASTECMVERAANRAEAAFVTGPDRSPGLRLFDVRVVPGGPRSDETILRARLVDGDLQVDYARAEARQGFRHAYAVRAGREPALFGPEHAPGIPVQEWSAQGATCAGLDALANAVASAAGDSASAAFTLLETGRSVPLERLMLHGDTWTFRASAGSAGGDLAVGDSDGSALAMAAEALRERVIECSGSEPRRTYEVGGITP